MVSQSAVDQATRVQAVCLSSLLAVVRIHTSFNGLMIATGIRIYLVLVTCI
jgi:hypothetical protein